MEQVSTPIYDLSIREIEIVMRKLEGDNINLRRELHESKVRLNEKDEEILRLRRELLLVKKERLAFTRKIVALGEMYQTGQVQVFNDFLLSLFGCNEEGGNGTWKPAVDYPVSGLSGGKLATSSGGTCERAPCQKAEVSTKKPAVEEYNPVEDELMHVRAPLSYQYRHLRLQTGTANHVEEYSVEGHDVNFGEAGVGCNQVD